MLRHYKHSRRYHNMLCGYLTEGHSKNNITWTLISLRININLPHQVSLSSVSPYESLINDGVNGFIISFYKTCIYIV